MLLRIGDDACSHARALSFADYQASARNGYSAGGMRPEAAAAIVAAASENISALVTRELTAGLTRTFILSLDLECSRYFRRNGAAALF
jgi:hypothetical protein